jgi:hypothetical protein
MWPAIWATVLCFAGVYFREQLYFYVWVLGVDEAPAYIVPSIFSTADASPFPCPQIYSPLNQSVDSLRILRLLPGSSGLSCRTETTTFREQPRYRALSYEWGSSDRTMPIVINNIETRVGQNLWEALYHLRHSREEQVLWADAICINQHDLAEKARLVPQMNLIYRRAAEVIVWLGPHQAPKAVDLNKMASWAFAPPKIDKTYHKNWWHEAVPWLFDLMHANYWKRTWIIQEIGEAVRLSVHFGKQSLSWEAFNSAVATYRICFPRALWTDRISALEDLRKSRREGEIYALTDLISIFRDTFCKVSHDKIYAFLGMAADDSPNFIPAAYNKSRAEVYSDIMQFLSGSTIDIAVKEVELVHMSALVRRLLTREMGTTVDIDEKPRSVLRQAEPYTYYERGEPDKDGKTELVAKTAYHKVWHEWQHSRHQQKTTYWLPTGPERLDLWTDFDPLPWQSAALKAKGIVLGKIESFGPTIEMFLTSNRVSKAWKKMIIQSFPEKPIQKKMIALYERLLDVVGREAAARSIDSITAFRSNNESTTTRATDSARLFIGSNGFLGIASPGVHIGDHVVHFWKSSASAIVRREGDSSEHGEYSVVGRCSIVKEGYSHDWDTPQDKPNFLSGDESSVYLHMDINTLTALTLNSLDLRNETPEARRRPRVHKL